MAPDPEPDPVFFECGHCNTRVQGMEHGRYDFYLEGMDMPEERILVSCGNCKCPNLIGREFYGTLGGTDQWGEWRVHPPTARTFGPDVPKAVRRTYDEAQVNLRSGSFLSTALMCRRSIELLAKHQGAMNGDLAKKLTKLKEDGVIDVRLFEWADALRLAGNDAAHEDDADYDITKEDADDLISFTEAIIDYVYIYKARFDEFRARRPRRTHPPQTSGPESRAGRQPTEPAGTPVVER